MRESVTRRPEKLSVGLIKSLIVVIPGNLTRRFQTGYFHSISEAFFACPMLDPFIFHPIYTVYTGIDIMYVYNIEILVVQGVASTLATVLRARMTSASI